MSADEYPGWLETLWNVNPRIAAEAEAELIILYAIKKTALELTQFINKIKNDYAEPNQTGASASNPTQVS